MEAKNKKMEELKKQIVELDKQIAEKEEAIENFEFDYKKDPEWQRLEKKRQELKPKLEAIEGKISAIDKKVKGKFTDEVGFWSSPYYKQGDRWSRSTNIHDWVIDAIKKHFRISLLRGGDVEDIVKSLIWLEKKKYPQLEKLEEEAQPLRREVEETKRLQWDIQREPAELRQLNRDLWNLTREKEKLQHQLDNPQIEKARTKREEERENVRDDDLIKAVMKTLDAMEGEDES